MRFTTILPFLAGVLTTAHAKQTCELVPKLHPNPNIRCGWTGPLNETLVSPLGSPCEVLDLVVCAEACRDNKQCISFGLTDQTSCQLYSRSLIDMGIVNGDASSPTVFYNHGCWMESCTADQQTCTAKVTDFVTVTRGTKTLKSTVFATKNLAQHTQKLRVTSTEVIPVAINSTITSYTTSMTTLAPNTTQIYYQNTTIVNLVTVNMTLTVNATAIFTGKAKRTELAADASVCRHGTDAPTVSSTITRTVYQPATVYELVTRYDATYTPASANITRTAIAKTHTTVATNYLNVTSTEVAVVTPGPATLNVTITATINATIATSYDITTTLPAPAIPTEVPPPTETYTCNALPANHTTTIEEGQCSAKTVVGVEIVPYADTAVLSHTTAYDEEYCLATAVNSSTALNVSVTAEYYPDLEECLVYNGTICEVGELVSSLRNVSLIEPGSCMTNGTGTNGTATTTSPPAATTTYSCNALPENSTSTVEVGQCSAKTVSGVELIPYAETTVLSQTTAYSEEYCIAAAMNSSSSHGVMSVTAEYDPQTETCVIYNGTACEVGEMVSSTRNFTLIEPGSCMNNGTNGNGTVESTTPTNNGTNGTVESTTPTNNGTNGTVESTTPSNNGTNGTVESTEPLANNGTNSTVESTTPSANNGTNSTLESTEPSSNSTTNSTLESTTPSANNGTNGTVESTTPSTTNSTNGTVESTTPSTPIPTSGILVVRGGTYDGYYAFINETRSGGVPIQFATSPSSIVANSFTVDSANHLNTDDYTAEQNIYNDNNDPSSNAFFLLGTEVVSSVLGFGEIVQPSCSVSTSGQLLCTESGDARITLSICPNIQSYYGKTWLNTPFLVLDATVDDGCEAVALYFQ